MDGLYRKESAPEKFFLLFGGLSFLIGVLSCLFEIFFSYAAERAYPVCRNVFKGCSRCDAAVRVTDFRIVNITANHANVLVHNKFVLNLFSGSLFCRNNAYEIIVPKMRMSVYLMDYVPVRYP